MSDHTPGAIKAAEAITGGTYGETTRYKTAYGMKTVMGIADIIDRKTAAPKLLQAVKECQAQLAILAEDIEDLFPVRSEATVLMARRMRALIAITEG